MPVTSPATAPASPPAVARPPLTGREDMTAVARYCQAKLSTFIGVRADGSPHFAVTGSGLSRSFLRHLDGGLSFTIERTDNGVTPYKITCSAEAQVAGTGLGGEPPKAVNVKLHANGDAQWMKIVTPALVFATRSAQAREVGRLVASRLEADRAALEAFATPLLASLPTPTREGSLLAGPLANGGTRNRTWIWDLTVREAAEGVTGLKLYATINIELPGARTPAAPAFDPAQHDVRVELGFNRYGRDSTGMKLREAVAMIRAAVGMAGAWQAGLTPREDAAPEVPAEAAEAPAVVVPAAVECPCESTDTVPVDPALIAREGMPDDARSCRSCGGIFTDADGYIREAASH